MTLATLTIHSHDTPDSLYDALARVFPETRDGKTRWVSFTANGVKLTFFGSDVNPEAALTDESYKLAEQIA